MSAKMDPELAKKLKWMQGFEDGQSGWPANRFMRNDTEYMAGYEEGSAEE